MIAMSSLSWVLYLHLIGVSLQEKNVTGCHLTVKLVLYSCDSIPNRAKSDTLVSTCIGRDRLKWRSIGACVKACFSAMKDLIASGVI